MTERIRTLLVDDHTILRQGLRMLIDAEPDMAVVGEASDGDEAVGLATSLQPDVVILDLSMPGRGGLVVLPELKKVLTNGRVLVLTMHDDPSHMKAVLAAGASGFVIKKAAHEELISSIRAVYGGRNPIGGVEFSDEALESFVGRAGTGPLGQLSTREVEVLCEIARGFTTKQIAERLGISLKTVETYRTRLTDKLGVRDRSDIVRIALELDLLTP
jgi:two-component system, NarL family, response regulator NreC